MHFEYIISEGSDSLEVFRLTSGSEQVSNVVKLRVGSHIRLELEIIGTRFIVDRTR